MGKVGGPTDRQLWRLTRRGRLLVTHVNEFDTVVHQVGEDRERMPAINREQVLNVLFLENAADERASINGCHQRIPPFGLLTRGIFPYFFYSCQGKNRQKRGSPCEPPPMRTGGARLLASPP